MTTKSEETASHAEFCEIFNAAKSLSASQRIDRLWASENQDWCFTTSFSLEDQALLNLLLQCNVELKVKTLDTGRLFDEIYQLWAETEKHYDIQIEGLSPAHEPLEQLVKQQGINGFYSSVKNRKACCEVRKIQPLNRALSGSKVWITGLRAEQSQNRNTIMALSYSDSRYKFNPIFDWSQERVIAEIQLNNIPYNPLHDRGYSSIGCAPCTRPISLGETPRAGRWSWEKNGTQECGLHTSNAQQKA